MKAAVITSPGACPRYDTFPDPAVGEGEVPVTVLAAGLHPLVRALAAGTHYGSSEGFPQVPGVDGVGRRPDGTIVYFGGVRDPYGTMAQVAPIAATWTVPLPAGADPVLVAAAMNPGLSGWLALVERAGLRPGETVLVLGATGAAGRLAIQAARRLGAGRVVAAGRDPRSLGELAARYALDPADVLRIDDPDRLDETLGPALDPAPDVVLDYLWGAPAEAVIRGLTRRGLGNESRRTRFVQVGESTGRPAISLPAGALRSSGLEILGSGAGSVPLARMAAQVPAYLELVASGAMQLDVEAIPLADVAAAWTASRRSGQRVVLVP